MEALMVIRTPDFPFDYTLTDAEAAERRVPPMRDFGGLTWLPCRLPWDDAINWIAVLPGNRGAIKVTQSGYGIDWGWERGESDDALAAIRVTISRFTVLDSTLTGLGLRGTEATFEAAAQAGIDAPKAFRAAIIALAASLEAGQ
jgi:hypothetical protein